MRRQVLVTGLVLLTVIILIILFVLFLQGGAISDSFEPTDTILNDFRNAVNSPGKTIVSENLEFPKDVMYFAETFISRRNPGENCFEFQASDSNTFDVHEGKIIQINDSIQTNVYYKCVTGATVGNDECPLFCIISFGKEIS